MGWFDTKFADPLILESAEDVSKKLTHVNEEVLISRADENGNYPESSFEDSVEVWAFTGPYAGRLAIVDEKVYFCQYTGKNTPRIVRIGGVWDMEMIFPFRRESMGD